MISAEKRDASLEYLVSTDEKIAEAKAVMISVENQKKSIIAIQTLQSDLKSQGLREHDAYTTKEYWQWRDKYRDAVYEYEIIRNKRVTATLIVEIWRSEFSARKQGMI